jgi:hypothetical protein
MNASLSARSLATSQGLMPLDTIVAMPRIRLLPENNARHGFADIKQVTASDNLGGKAVTVQKGRSPNRKEWWAGAGLNRRHQDFQFSSSIASITRIFNDLLSRRHLDAAAARGGQLRLVTLGG